MRETSELLEMFYILATGAQLGTVLASRGYVARSGDILSCHNLGGGQGPAGIQWVEVAEHTDPLREPRIIWPKCPWCENVLIW